MRTLRWILVSLVATGLCRAQAPSGDGQPSSRAALVGPAADLFRKAQQGKWFVKAQQLQPEIVPTSDGRSFLVVWRPSADTGRWIVSLHGTSGFATDDLAIWHPSVKGLGVGLVCVQWWLGEGDDRKSYLTPEQIYREVDVAARKLGIRPGAAMLHGFSRGAANSYAVMALDAGRGRRYFSLAVASSGGVAIDYLPTRSIVSGTYGESPLRGTRWVTCAGDRDGNPDRDGFPGMRRTAAWLREQGAIVVESIEDPREGHGALHRNPDNARRVLGLFLSGNTGPRPGQEPRGAPETRGR